MPPVWTKRIFGIITALHVAGAVCPAQYISGVVVDGKTGTPLPGVNVFISGTTYGDATAQNGTFEIETVPAGTHELVASMVGYQPKVQVIRIARDGAAFSTVRLQEAVYETGEAVVTSEQPKNWQRHLERFVREFIGTSPNARDCAIQNPYVLDFETESATSTLRASAVRPLEIVNRALGYRIIFVLRDFEVANWTYTVRYKGHTRFEELKPESDTERDVWERNRARTYSGSFQHFLHSLARGNTEAEGFELRLADDVALPPGEINLLPKADIGSILFDGMTPFERLFYSSTPLHVAFQEEAEPGSYQRFVTEITGRPYRRGDAQHSVLVFDRAVTVHTSGYLYEPYRLKTYGYWIWERVADMLPRDYTPLNDTRVLRESNG